MHLMNIHKKKAEKNENVSPFLYTMYKMYHKI